MNKLSLVMAFIILVCLYLIFFPAGSTPTPEIQPASVTERDSVKSPLLSNQQKTVIEPIAKRVQEEEPLDEETMRTAETFIEGMKILVQLGKQSLVLQCQY